MKAFFIPTKALQDLLQELQNDKMRTIGPQAKDGAIVYDDIRHIDQLPWGIRDRQSPGQYQLEPTEEQKAFGFSNGPEAIKPLLFKPSETVWKVKRSSEGKLVFEPRPAAAEPVAILGAKACDLAAMRIQDKVFMEGAHQDEHYSQRRQSLFIIAVNCSYASDNCFCLSAGTGPEVRHSYDLLLTEIEQGFLIESGSETGEGYLKRLPALSATAEQIKQAKAVPKQTAAMQKKRIPKDNSRELKDVLFNQLEHPRWQEVAQRCLSCGNCTSVCPTCFCSSHEEKPSLDGQESEHEKRWGSCFSADHSLLGGRPLRDSTEKRYKQWLTHKVGSWWEQFDSSGCVGCGRCVSWCPVGIDLTEELAVISGESNQRGGQDEQQ